MKKEYFKIYLIAAAFILLFSRLGLALDSRITPDKSQIEVNSVILDIYGQRLDKIEAQLAAHDDSIHRIDKDTENIVNEVNSIAKVTQNQYKYTKEMIPKLEARTKILRGRAEVTNNMQGIIIGYLYLIKNDPTNADKYFNLMMNRIQSLTGVDFSKFLK